MNGPLALEQKQVTTAPEVAHSLRRRPLLGQVGWAPQGATASLERPSPDSMNDSLPPSGAWHQGLESIILCHLSRALQATKPLSQGGW